MINSREYYVVIFDVCSSSVILEKLQQLNKLKLWRKMWKRIFTYANRIAGERGKCRVYKFVGDGFILLYFPNKKDSLLSFCDNIIKFVSSELEKITSQNNIEPKRKGITIGIDKGKLIPMRLYGSKEYMGEAINVAARLQAILKKPEDVNTVLVSKKVYQDVKSFIGQRKVVQTKQILHNLFDDTEVDCYQIY